MNEPAIRAAVPFAVSAGAVIVSAMVNKVVARSAHEALSENAPFDGSMSAGVSRTLVGYVISWASDVFNAMSLLTAPVIGISFSAGLDHTGVLVGQAAVLFVGLGLFLHTLTASPVHSGGPRRTVGGVSLVSVGIAAVHCAAAAIVYVALT